MRDEVTFADGVLTIDPKVKGDIVVFTEKTFDKDAHIKFEFKPGKGCNNDLYFRGLKFDLKTPDVKNMKEGEWNAFEIVVTGEIPSAKLVWLERLGHFPMLEDPQAWSDPVLAWLEGF